MASLSDSSSSSSLDPEPILRSWHSSLFSYLGMSDNGSTHSEAVLETVRLAAHQRQPSAFAPWRPILISRYPEATTIIRNLTGEFREGLARRIGAR
eukprot:8278991-Alexandrium_andersonii.AAC.1